MTIQRVVTFVLLIGLCQFGLARQSQSLGPAQRAKLDADLKNAIQAVQKIVNQPVKSIQRTPEMKVALFQPGWFHDGAIKPDFNKVDVRTTRETSYDKYEYVTSDLNPGIAFVGSELEFNAMTKAFYLDRTLPKKKLSEAEMLEINRLYRIIGHCEQELGIQ